MTGYHEVKVFRFPNFLVGEDTVLMPDGWKPIQTEMRHLNRDGRCTLLVSARKWHRRERLPVRTRAKKSSA